MRSLINNYRNSPIIRKTIRRLITIEVFSLLLVIILLFCLLLPRLRRAAVQDGMKTMASLGAQVDNVLDGYSDFSKFILRSDELNSALDAYWTEPTERNFNLVCLALHNQHSSISSIRGIQLEHSGGTIFRSVINLRQEDYKRLEEEWYKTILKSVKASGFSTIYDPGLASPSSALAYSCTYYIGTNKYVLTLFFNCSNLVSIIDKSSAVFDGVSVTDYTGVAFYESGNTYDETTVLNDNSAVIKGHVKYRGNHYFITTSKSCEWKIMGCISDRKLISGYWSIFFSAMVMCLILCFITLVSTIPAMNKVISPIHALSRDMKKVSESYEMVFTKVESDDEIGELSRIFNEMLVNLSEHMNQQILHEANEQKMRYNLLLAQIDSHFISNTMSIINSLARQNKNAEVVAVNSALMKIIQNTLRIRDMDIADTLAQELEMVRQYWIIAKVRTENHCNLHIDVPDELLETIVPKNIIQPLVENCIFHGLVDEVTGEINGDIYISAEDTGEYVRIEVRDNGKGIPDEVLEYLNNPDKAKNELLERGRHIGLANIRNRLSYVFGRDCMRIYSDNGTVVVLCIDL
ncbi:MAG: sensor histidine kinase [Oscillospiraceae bacterium]|jgi:two-component system sensor histidine kinase YesM